jgi:butyryl-CoA dehydrogenase
MTYQLTEREQRLLQDAQQYGSEHFLPHAAAWDREGIFPTETFLQAGRDGYLGLNTAREFGGRGLSFLETALIYQGLARSSFPFVLAMECHNNMTYEMSVFKSSAAVRGMLAQMISGEKILGFGFTEPQAGSDPSAMTSCAKKVPGGYLVNGCKTWVTNGSQASLFDVTVKLEEPGAREMITLLIDIPSEGLKVTHDMKTMGGNVLSKATIVLTDCFVPEDRVVSTHGYRDALWSVLLARIFTPAMAIGLCEEALEQTAAYLARRSQFGQPLLKQRPLQWKLVELQTKVAAGRHLVYHTAACMDSGRNPDQEAAMSKLYCGDLAMEVTTACCQLFGAEGYRTGNVLERLMREAKMVSVIDGTSEIQKLILGNMLERAYLPDKRYQLSKKMEESL